MVQWVGHSFGQHKFFPCDHRRKKSWHKIYFIGKPPLIAPIDAERAIDWINWGTPMIFKLKHYISQTIDEQSDMWCKRERASNTKRPAHCLTLCFGSSYNPRHFNKDTFMKRGYKVEVIKEDRTHNEGPEVGRLTLDPTAAATPAIFLGVYL